MYINFTALLSQIYKTLATKESKKKRSFTPWKGEVSGKRSIESYRYVHTSKNNISDLFHTDLQKFGGKPGTIKHHITFRYLSDASKNRPESLAMRTHTAGVKGQM